MPEQEKWAEHAAFIYALADDGFVVLGGPLGDGARILLIIDAEVREPSRRDSPPTLGRRWGCSESPRSNAGRSCSAPWTR
jgi:hypothetical protein